MIEKDKNTARNRDWWAKMVKEGCGFTRPWLDLEKQEILEYILEPQGTPNEQLDTMFPADILSDVDGKDVLCLASGGGQQSAVFSLLGAQVTVVDITEGQLEGDRIAAEHYGYEITAMRADMRDLSLIENGSFDLVYQAPSMSYIPIVREVYPEVARILRSGGLYRVAHTNPAVEFIETNSWDGEGYRISLPYTVRQVEYGEKGSIQFRHYLSDIFNGLLGVGFSIQSVQEAPVRFQEASEANPGTWEHSQMYVPWILAIVARNGENVLV